MPKQNRYGPGIVKQKHGFYATRQVPKHLQQSLGKKRLIQTLQTDSISEARRRAPLVLAKFDAILNKPNEPLDTRWWRTMLSGASEEEREVFMDEVDAVVGLEDRTTANQIKSKVLSPLTEKHIGAYLQSLDSRELRDNTLIRQRQYLMVLCARFPYLHQLTKKAVAGFVEELLSEKAAQTVRGYKSAWNQYYEYLSRNDLVDADNPFRVLVRENRKRSKVVRQEFTREQIRTLLHESTSDPLLHDIILLAAHTGCRIGELCKLRIADVQGDIITIRDAKSAAGNRQVPLHSAIQGLVQRRMGNRVGEEFVLDYHTGYRDRASLLTQRFSALKKRLGYGPELVFHSIRKTVATMFENAGVAETTAEAILGHEHKSMSYGLYSGGPSAELKRKAIETIRYF